MRRPIEHFAFMVDSATHEGPVFECLDRHVTEGPYTATTIADTI